MEERNCNVEDDLWADSVEIGWVRTLSVAEDSDRRVVCCDGVWCGGSLI